MEHLSPILLQVIVLQLHTCRAAAHHGGLRPTMIPIVAYILCHPVIWDLDKSPSHISVANIIMVILWWIRSMMVGGNTWMLTILGLTTQPPHTMWTGHSDCSFHCFILSERACFPFFIEFLSCSSGCVTVWWHLVTVACTDDSFVMVPNWCYVALVVFSISLDNWTTFVCCWLIWIIFWARRPFPVSTFYTFCL